MMKNNRNKRAEIARNTLEICTLGWYENQLGQRVEIAKELEFATKNSILYGPGNNFVYVGKGTFQTEITVENETTIDAIIRLASEETSLMCLNFASAKNPGGGFLGGSAAQEESLARSSGLYACIEPQQAYYQANRNLRSCLYTDHIIYSPAVPFFKDDEGTLLDNPVFLGVITAPAVNYGALAKNEPEKLSQAEPIMKRRVGRMLSICNEHGHDHLILGAWGCGVFRNDPKKMASYFAEYLLDGEFCGVFRKVHFAVLDRRDSGIFEAFKNKLTQ